MRAKLMASLPESFDAIRRGFAGLPQDLYYSARVLRRQPGFAAVAVLTTALGIGATTTLFSVAYGVLLKPLPWPDADRIVRVTETRNGQAARIRGTVTNAAYLAWSERPETIEALAGYSVTASTMTVRVGGSHEPVRVPVGRVTPSMFEVLRASPLRGRAFVPDDARIGGGAYPDPQVVLLSYGLWQDAFGGHDDVIGTTVHVDQVPVTIVGVMPPDFLFPDRDTRAWLPMPVGSVLANNGVRRIMIFGALARVAPGVSFEQAAAEGTQRARTAPDPGLAAVSMFGSAAPPVVSVTSAAEAMTADVKPAITLLMIAAALLLATSAANVAGLQLARSTTRRREMAVRTAIGAGAGRLAWQLLVESAIIGAAGCGAGLVLAAALHQLLPALLPSDFPRIGDIAMHPAVVAFAIAVSSVSTIACGLLPALHGRRVDLVEALGDNGTSTAQGWRSRAGRLRTLVMAAQVAVACVLLVGAALLTRSFVALLTADRGYDPVNLLTARVDLGAAYDGARRAALADTLIERLQAIPGIADVTAGNALPLASMGGTMGFAMPSPADPAITQDVQTITRIVSPTYFRTLRLRMIEGRPLSDHDTLASRPVVVVNRTFAQRFLGHSPIGARLPLSFGEGRPDCDVVGIVEDMRQSAVSEPPAAEVFMSYRQMPERLLYGPLFVVVRTDGDPVAHAATLRAAVREQDPQAGLDSLMTMEERVLTNLARPRLYAVLLGVFGIFALVIAGVGLFGVLSYAVAQRAREIGVRTALGAQTRDIVSLVLSQAAVVAAAGVIAGSALALGASRFLAAFLYGVAPDDTASFAIAAVALAATVVIACVVPARRAARVDAVQVLKAS